MRFSASCFIEYNFIHELHILNNQDQIKFDENKQKLVNVVTDIGDIINLHPCMIEVNDKLLILGGFESTIYCCNIPQNTKLKSKK